MKRNSDKEVADEERDNPFEHKNVPSKVNINRRMNSVGRLRRTLSRRNQLTVAMSRHQRNLKDIRTQSQVYRQTFSFGSFPLNKNSSHSKSNFQ